VAEPAQSEGGEGSLQTFRPGGRQQAELAVAERGGTGEANALAGDGISDVDQRRPVGDNRFQDRREKGVMGTTENDLVHAGGEQGGQMLPGFFDKVRLIEAQGFDSGGPAGQARR
jgi:hypothetical protein